MFGIGIWEVLIILIILIVIGIPIYISYKLCKIKGLSGGWAFLNFASFPIALLVIGFMKPAPGYETDRAKRYSTTAIVAGGVFLILPILASFMKG